MRGATGPSIAALSRRAASPEGFSPLIDGRSQGRASALLVTAPYALCVCPEGQNVTLTCRVSGPLADHHDLLYKTWYFSGDGDRSCSEKRHIRNATERELRHEAAGHHGPAANRQGALQNCTFHAAASQDTTAAALATGACIVGILCLPLILLLIYKQRQAITNRRAHELVRMESSAQGIENPVFEAVPAAETWPRGSLPYAPTRQPSESGRRLLSEPSTPLSPPGPGDCFFPTLDPVPDSPSSPKA
ncbi:PREDICTED: platelet receptor Gi24 [Tinamus guttatus]|uniref:platelet receptor Gi24 n=1 Tax=Tinamus guttatus TaxID=94827 RepID=UPI00052EB1B6|nr:PREDICTED: platelet receptor Gi24 [Tinamus guttatus]